MFGKSATTAAGKQYANAFANMDVLEDDFQDDDYGDYYDEEDPSMDDALLRQQLAQQQKIAALSQQKVPAYSGPGSQPIGANLYGAGGGAGQFGAGMMNFGAGAGAGLGTQFGGTQFGASSGMMGGSGGFSYGMASAGGSTFGSTPLQSSAKPQSAIGLTAPKTTGGFSFGSASQFGGIGGSSAGQFGGGSVGQFGTSTLGPSAVNDPYANVDLDLSKVKTVTIPSKPFEKKTEEEKVEDKKTLGSNKSSLKTTKEDFDKAASSKKEVRFGKSITYQVEGDSEPSILTDKVTKNIIDEKDLSDGRDEKEKIKAIMEQETAQQLEDIRIMNEWKAKQAAQDKLKAATTAVTPKVPTAQPVDIESSGASSSKSKQEGIADSYTSDDFEDTSMSGSGGQINQIAAAAKLPTVNNLSNAQKTGPATKPLKKIEESSDIYEDDDFESLSRSQQQMNQILPIKKPSPLPTALPKAAPIQQTIQQLPKAQLIRKENQATMTDVGKYNYSLDPTSGALTLKEMSLKRQLDDAEIVMQEQRISIQTQRDENKELELKLKQKDSEFQSQRREAMNSQESAKRMQDQLKELQHRCNLYKIETEELIKEIDKADAKTREREDQLALQEAEYTRNLRAQQERILFQRGKTEEREVLDIKHEHSIQLEELKRKYEEMRDENDYLNSKVVKLEQTNKELRLSKDAKDATKSLQNEVNYLQQQLAQYQKQDSTKFKSDISNIKKELTLAEQINIQKELAQVDLIIKGYQEENKKAEVKFKEVSSNLKLKDKEISDLKRQIHDLEIKKMLDADKVFVEEHNSEVDLQTANIMGPSNSISQKQLKELQDQIIGLRSENDNLKRDWNLKEQQLKQLAQKVRDEKTQLEKQLYQIEFLVQEKNSEIQKIRDDFIQERNHLEEKIKELTEKVAWFRQNQSLLTDQEQQLSCQLREIADLKTSLKRSEDERLKQKDLEKRCKLLEETIKAKNPNAVPALIQATSNLANSASDNTNEKQLKFRVAQLEGELDERDKEFQRRIRALRQEQERMRQIYEERAANPTEARKVNELEQEIQRTKTYYQKRIRELEDKYKFKVNIGKAEEGLSDLIELKPAKSTNPVAAKKPSDAKGSSNTQLEQTITEMTEDRNMLVARLQQSLKKIEQLQAEITRLESEKQNDDGFESKLQENHMQKSKTQIPLQNEQQIDNRLNQQKTLNRNPKLNPFFVEEQAQEIRSVPQILKLLQVHQNSLTKFANKQIKITDLKSLIKGQATEAELQNLSTFLNEQKLQDVDSVAIDDLGKSYIDINDVLDHLASQSPGSCSPSQELNSQRLQTQNLEPRAGNAAYQDLKREFNRLQREKEDDNDFFTQKVRQLKRQLQQAVAEKNEAEEYCRQLEGQKVRLEKFLKQGLTKGGTTEELVQDVNFVMRRLEMLEQQAEERAQVLLGEQTPTKRKIEMLQQQLIEERALRENVIQKKNSEVAYFKKELENLLDEIAKKSTNKAF